MIDKKYYIYDILGGNIEIKNNDDIIEKLKNVIFSNQKAMNKEKRIEEFSNLIKRLEKMEPSLKDEFLVIIDDIISEGNIDVIIKEDIKVKKK